MLVRRLRRTHGEEGLARLLELAGSERTIAYLDELTNWISYDEAMALFRAAEIEALMRHAEAEMYREKRAVGAAARRRPPPCFFFFFFFLSRPRRRARPW